MHLLIRSESGVAYGYVIMLLALLMGSMLWIMLSVPVNEISRDLNDAIAEGSGISEQTAKNYDLANRIYKYVLPIGLLFIIGSWGITRANREDQ